MEQLFQGIFDAEGASVVAVGDFFLCIFVSLVLGVILALTFMQQNRYTKSFVVTLTILPAVVCVVIMMVNGNVGTGVAVAGAFSLVRFRSAPGTAREIVMLFLAMAAGLLTGMGYLGYSALFTCLMCGVLFLCTHLNLGNEGKNGKYKTLTITIPEDLDYTEVFDEVFDRYTSSRELIRVKTTNMGSLFRLTYDLVLKETKEEKAMIDQLRCRNGNLEISISRQETAAAEL